MLSTLIDLGYMISDDGCVSGTMIKHLQKKSKCVSHAIQVSRMNAHFPIFKSDTIYTVTILMRGIRGKMGVEGRKSLISVNTGRLSDPQPIDSPTSSYGESV